MRKYFLLVGALCIFVAISTDRALIFIRSYFKTAEDKKQSQIQLFTVDELKQYNGIDKPELYLALVGKVFDVTKGSKHYGPGETYNGFVGRDASRNFLTGNFGEKDEISDMVADLSQQDLRSLNNWVKFYKKDYKLVGKLIGRYYDTNGKPTPYGREVKRLIKLSENDKDNEDLEKRKFPPCNVEWDADRGTRVWCTKRSGGIERNWAGLPRQLYEPGSNSYRCACIHSDHISMGNIKEYEGCDKNSPSCFVKT